MQSLAQKWLRLSGRIALLCGLGALSAAGSQTEAKPLDEGKQPARVPQQSAKSFGDMQIWSDDGRIFLAEAGGEARELQLGDTAEARHLRELLQRGGADAASPQTLQHRVILVGGGGEGFHWTPPRATGDPGMPVSPTADASAAKPAEPSQSAVQRGAKPTVGTATPVPGAKN